MEILIVDDEPIFLMMHGKIIEKIGLGLPAKTFLSGEELIFFLVNNNNENKKYLIFCDIFMYPMDAWDILAYLETANLLCEIKIIIVTSSVDRIEMEKSKNFSNVVDFLIKPINQDLVKEIIENAF
jgi:CheY-like chemotaxis protein